MSHFDYRRTSQTRQLTGPTRFASQRHSNHRLNSTILSREGALTPVPSGLTSSNHDRSTPHEARSKKNEFWVVSCNHSYCNCITGIGVAA